MENKSFQELFKELLDAKGITSQRLSELSGVPLHYIEALANGDKSRLPARAYVHGYLKKIGPHLGINWEELWEKYKQSQNLNSSGVHDRMPQNRFAIRKVNRGFLAAGLVFVVILLYFSFHLEDILGIPSLVLENPASQETITSQNIFTIQGTVSKGDKLTINGEDIVPDAEGRFSKEVLLDPGLNTFTIKAKRSLGGERTIMRRIIYKPTEK
jgi:cytoskeletal protein RodZ